MRSFFLIASISLCASALGCSSSDSGGGTSGASSSGGEGGAATGNAGASTSAGASNTSAGSGGGSSAGASGGSSTLSPACQMYCDCHEMNCASTPIPGGVSCADFCAGMTADQLACRQNMCGLVPAQPDNDHCTHSVGIIQCL